MFTSLQCPRIPVCALALTLAVTSSAATRRAPLNSRFEEWSNRRAAAEAHGLIPSPVDRSYLARAYRAITMSKTTSGASRRLLKADAIPSRWDSREQGWVTPIRNQGAYGTCWAHSTLACLETATLKATGGAVTNDLSENHLAAHRVGFVNEVDFDVGGNNQMALAMLTAWSDPLDEADDPYPHPDSTVSLPPMQHVQNAVMLPGRESATDNDMLKRAVMDYGAVAVYYYDHGSWRNSTTGGYCYRGKQTANHSVALIGWDDAYPTNNFVSGRQPASPGAFLVKNSWGTTYGTNGCLWISYEDSAFAMQESTAYPVPEATNNYGRVYQHDLCGWVMNYNSDGEENWCANVFTSVSTGLVAAVGFYAVSPDIQYVLRVYVRCGNDPTSGTLAVEQSGAVSAAGYVTVPLVTDAPILSIGERFAVVLRLESASYGYPMPGECTEDGYCTATANAGESFYSANGLAWTDIHDEDPSANFCIKAYTRFGCDGPGHMPTTVHVDAASGTTVPDGSAERPFATIADALVISAGGDTVRVAAGRYCEPVVVPPWPLRIESVDGPEVTIIEGGVANCCYDGTANEATELAGFTLENGGDGGVVGGLISNCVIRGCWTTDEAGGGGAFGATLIDCVISNCTAVIGGGATFSTLTNCLIVGNRAEVGQGRDSGAGGGAYDCQLVNCTLAGNTAARFGGGVYLDSGSAVRNTIITTNVCDEGAANGHDIYGMGEMVCSISGQDVRFVNAANGDWRLSARSPCIDAGSNAFVMVSHDLAGTNRVIGARVDLGCFEFTGAPVGWPVPAVARDAAAAEEAVAVAAAMLQAGFPASSANVLTSVAQYAAFAVWADEHHLAVDNLVSAPTAFLSAALDAPGVLGLVPSDLRTASFVPTSDGAGWSLTLALSPYDPTRVSPALLSAAVGVVGAHAVDGTYSPDGLDVSVRATSDGVEMLITPPPGASAYFLRPTVR